MKSYSSREVIRMLTDDGWYEVNCEGDHHQFKLTSSACFAGTFPKGEGFWRMPSPLGKVARKRRMR